MTPMPRADALAYDGSRENTPDDQLDSAIFTALADPEQPRLVFQPIVDLQTGDVVGFETLSRFVSPLSVSPDRWFAAANRLGVGGRLQANVIRRGIERLAALPDGMFLAVNLDPRVVTAPEIAELLTSGVRLDRLVIELTEQTIPRDVRQMLTLLDRAREAGAIVAMDEHGGGYESLQNLVTVRPELVKLDRSLVIGLDRDIIRRALVRMLVEFVGRMGARMLAEGLEAPGELRACVDLGVPLGQGWLLGRPADHWQLTTPPAVVDEIHARMRQRDAGNTLASLVDVVPAVASRDEAAEMFATHADMTYVVMVADGGRPVAVLERTTVAADGAPSRPLVAGISDRSVDVAVRAAERAAHARFDPVVCCDQHGRYQGIVTVDRLFGALATCDSATDMSGGRLVPSG